MEKMSLPHCINCSAEVDATYCSKCGQKAAVNRIKWSVLLSELNQRILGLDNRFARTVKDLTIRPGSVVQAFIDGNRVKYINPVGYMFILITIYVLLISILNVDMLEFTMSTGDIFQNQGPSTIEAEGFQRLLISNLKLLTFALIPFFALGAYTIFRRKAYNLLETAVLIFYTHAHPLFLSIIALFTFKFFGVSGNSYIFPLMILYFAYACAGFYPGSKVANFIKGLLSYLLGFMFFVLLLVAMVLLLAAIDRELFEMLFPRKI